MYGYCNIFISQAEYLKKHIEKEKEAGKYHEKIEIGANSVGHSYKTILGRFLDEYVTKVEVEDPYIRSHHQVSQFLIVLIDMSCLSSPIQVYNLLRLCELLVGSCRNLKSVSLLTGKEPGTQQDSMLDELKQSLAKHNVILTVEYSATLHDREIRLEFIIANLVILIVSNNFTTPG